MFDQPSGLKQSFINDSAKKSIPFFFSVLTEYKSLCNAMTICPCAAVLMLFHSVS